MAYEVSISGAALASLLHLASTSPSDSSGLLSGHLSSSPSPALSDFDPAPSSSPSSSLFLTRLLSFNSPLSFFSPLGHVRASFLPDAPLLGWFSFRRNSSLRPSMRDLAVSLSLSKTLPNTPCVFLLLSSSLSPNRAVHTHDYRAFLLRSTPPPALNANAHAHAKPLLQPISLRVLNVGLGSTAGQYGAFSAHFSLLPAMPCAIPGIHDAAADPMLVCAQGGQKKSKTDETLLVMKEKAQHQKLLDVSTQGFAVDMLEKLLGGSALAYTQQIEDLYASMLCKLQSLTHQLEKTSALVFEQENQNLELRCKLAGME